jgi:hypothetical protein
MKSVRAYVGKLLETEGMPNPDELDQPSKEDISKLIKTNAERDTFTTHYLIAALWSSMDNSDPETGGDPMDKNYDLDDIAPMCLREAIRDCRRFQKENAELLAQAGNDEQNGHDFWLTRNGHGAGFWDRGYPDEVGDALTDAAHAYGEIYLYVGDDNLIHSNTEHIIESAPIDEPDPQSYLDWLKKKTKLGGLSDLHLGFAISTTDEYVLRDNARERGIDVDNKTISDMISHDYSKIEKNAVRLLKVCGFNVRDEGHSDQSLVGSLWIDNEGNEKAYSVLKLAADSGEPFSTSSGTIGALDPDADKILYQGTSNYSGLIDINIEFLDMDKFRDWFEVNSLGESLDDIDDPLSTIKAGNWRTAVEQDDFKPAGANTYWKSFEANEGKCMLWIVYTNRRPHVGDIEFKASYADAGWPGRPGTPVLSNFLNYTVFARTSWINILLPKIYDFSLRAKLANMTNANMATRLLNAIQMWADQIKMSSLPTSTNESVDDLDPEEVKELALRKFKIRDVPPPEHRAKSAVFAREETTTDSATKDMLKAGGDVDFKNLPRYKDVVIYSDPECTNFIARIPWHASGKPVSRSKKVTLNCMTRPLYWVK